MEQELKQLQALQLKINAISQENQFMKEMQAKQRHGKKSVLAGNKGLRQRRGSNLQSNEERNVYLNA